MSQSKKIAAKRRAKGHKHVDCLNEDHDIGFAPVDVTDAAVTTEEPEMSRAYRKFVELDVDKSGKLNTEELFVLADFLYTSFNAKGEVLDPGN